MLFRSVSQEAIRLDLVRATLHYAAENTRYYRQAFVGLDLSIESLEALQRFPLLKRETLAKRGSDLLVEGVVPEYVGITSGTTFGDASREPLLHFQTESEHRAWVSLYAIMVETAKGDRPLMLRLTDPDRGVEIAGAFPGCFSVPLENPYHFELILSILRREWNFPGFSKRVVSLSGPLDVLQLLTLLCIERHIDPAEFRIGLITSSGWQMTSRWHRLLESYWGANIQDVYGLSEAPGMYATRCMVCSHYHFSPLSVIEVLRLDRDELVTTGIGRVVVTCLLPVAHAQPIIRYDTEEVIDIVDECDRQGLSFEYLGRRSKLILLEGANGFFPILSPLIVTEVLDSMPDVAFNENTKAKQLGLRAGFGWPRYFVRQERDQSRMHVW
jgi:phenylacetate-coenzyme A ligase PaaK-like adenylate-forming protein